MYWHTIELTYSEWTNLSDILLRRDYQETQE
ncbi:hypothetical protein BH10BAC2_BH10BAC2_04620 [soil metagenome]